MDLIIADFVVPVTTDGTNRLHFSIPEIPLSLRVLQEGGDDRELTAEEKMIPRISRTIEACKLRASIEVFYCTEQQKIKMILGSDEDLSDSTEADGKASVYLRYEPCKGAGYRDLASVEAPRIKGGSQDFRMHHYLFSHAPNIHVKVLVHFSEGMLLPEVHPPPRRILEDGMFSDVTIVAANGAEIKGHRSFLAVQSPVLLAMFSAEMEESRTSRVDMKDISEPGIRAFLRFLYYGDLSGPKKDPEIAFQVLYAAHKYQVAGLEAKMIKGLTERKNDDFNVEVAFKVYMFIRNLESGSAVQLKTKTIQILIGKMDELRTLQKYKDLFEDPYNSGIAMQVLEDFAVTKLLP